MRDVCARFIAGLGVLVASVALAQPQAGLPEAAHADADATPLDGHGHGLPAFDIRLDDDAARARVAERLAGPAQLARLEAAEALVARVPGARIDFDEVLGTPGFVRSTRAMLTAPAQGPFTPRSVLRDFAMANPRLVRVGAADVDGARVTRDAKSEHNGVTSLWLQQNIGGVDVLGAELRGSVLPDGRLATVSSTMLETPDGGFAIEPVRIDRAAAIRLAAESIGLDLAAAPVAKTPAPDALLRQSFARTAQLAMDVETRFVYFPMNAAELRPAYNVLVSAAGSDDVYEVVVDGATGAILSRQNRTWYDGTLPATYRVYTGDSPAPRTPGPNTPDGSQAPYVARTLMTLISTNPVASPDGWIPDASNETLGNNVDAHLDRNADNAPDLPRPQGSPNRVFDFTLDPTVTEPTEANYQKASVVQLFYWTNWYHDRLYELGFTEPFANFQQNNFGRGGVGGDRVLADCQDGSSTNNANFFTTGDGSSARVQMYLWPNPTPGRDGSLDGQVVLHELTHGTSVRLHGSLSSAQSAGMGEGWSDFYALSMLAEPADDPNAVYGLGGYATYLGQTGFVNNYYFGIRRFPYSTDLNKSPLTYADIDPGQFGFNGSIPRGPYGGSNAAESHNVGEIWCAILWQARAQMIGAHGFAANQTMLQLVTDGMKLSPSNPTLIQSRDAILLADLIDNAGANQCLLWAGFAARGLGEGATGPGASSTSGVVESYAVPTGVDFFYPEAPPPDRAAPATPTTFNVTIAPPCAGAIVDGSQQLFVSINGGPFTPSPLAALGDDRYEATFPLLACGQQVRYYVQATSTLAGVFNDPPGAPGASRALFVATSEPAVFTDDFSTDQGWTVGAPGDNATTGIWVRVDPNGTAAQPEDDHTPGADTMCYVTGQGSVGGAIGDNDVDGGTTTLTSPAFDCTGGDAFLSYWRWYSNDQGAAPNADSMPVQISNNNGMTWTLLEDVSENAGAWVHKSWRVADFVTPTTQVRVRFQARDLGSGSIVEAGVDDVSVTTLECDFVPNSADLNGDGVVGAADLALLLGSWGPCPPPCPADLNGDGAVNATDLALLLGSWG